MTGLRQRGALVCGLLLVLAAAHGQLSQTSPDSVCSVSGQFLVAWTGGSPPPYRNLNPNADTNVLQLKAPLLAVSAERFKLCLWQQLGIASDASWSGKIFLDMHPASSLDETETIVANPFLDHWNYRVELPDMLWKTRYARMLSGVLLLELADRNAPRDGHTAEVPAWLVDGLAQQVVAIDGEKIFLAVARKKGDTLNLNRIHQSERGFDPLAGARRILQATPALTFDQLSWPTDEQMNGANGGVYLASAQLFQHELLELKDGHNKMRAMLAELPKHLNWQTSFFQEYGQDFKTPLEVEKWWALRVVNFTAHGPGPHWTTDVSQNRLRELLSVPVDYRTGSNALPAHAEVSLQVALQSLGAEERENIIRTRARDLAVVELRLAPPFGSLADAYRVALNDFLGEMVNVARPSMVNKHAMTLTRSSSVAETVNRLNFLDQQLRLAEQRAASPLQARARIEGQPNN